MSNIVDQVLTEVCLDERITDGIFRMDEASHMDALRDYFVKRGLTKEASINITNQMLEGRFPERQAYNKDGVLVTFPTPQHKKRAISRKTHFEKNPRPQQASPEKESPAVEPRDRMKLPPKEEQPRASKEEPLPDDLEKNYKIDNIKKVPTIFQGDKKLEIEPPHGSEQSSEFIPKSPLPPPAPKSPEKIAAEKEVAKQIIYTDDSALTSVSTPMDEVLLKHQLNELYKKADEWGFDYAVTFLQKYVKS